MKKILFLGASYAQTPAIHMAKELGLYVITCDNLPNNPGHRIADENYNVSTTDKKSVLALAAQLEVDLIMAYASDPAAPVAAYVSEKLDLPGNSYDSVVMLSEKDLFRKFLAENGFNTPQIVSISHGENNLEDISQLKLPIIIKPTDSSGSKGVIKVSDLSQIDKALDYALSFSRNKRLIAEEFIESSGKQIHGDGFVLNGELIFTYLGDHRYNKDINPFVPYSTTWPTKFPSETLKRVEKELKAFIGISNYNNGPINIEVRVDENGKIYIMEIGPRSGGNFVPQVIKYATGFDLLKASFDVLENSSTSEYQSRNKFAAYYVLHSEHNGILSELNIKSSLEPFIQEFHQYIFSGEEVKSFQGANAAIGIFILLFENEREMDEVIQNMDAFLDISIKTTLQVAEI